MILVFALRASWIWGWALALGAITAPARAAEIPRALEPVYAQAVLLYSQRDYSGAERLLNQLLSRASSAQKPLELKAILLKARGDDEGAARIYSLLIAQSARDASLKSWVPSYDFELGLIRFHQKKLDEAKGLLQKSLAANFNLVASHFFLGLITFEKGDLSEAEGNFLYVAGAGATDLQPSAQTYLGQIASRNGDAPSTIRSFVAAREQAQEQLHRAGVLPEARNLANQVIASTSPPLDEFNRPTWFGNITLVSSYDSNVLSVPSTSASTTGATGPGSPKFTLKAGLGYTSPPLSSLQFVPSYQGTVNYNANQSTNNGQFFTHDVNLFLNHDAYEPTSYGLKLEGFGIFQYQVDPDTQNGSFGPYSLQGSLGPYWRTEIQPRTLLELDAFFEPVRNYLDPVFATTAQKSGWDQLVRASWTRQAHARFWNPGATIVGLWTQTTGTEFQSRALTLELNDAMNLKDSLLVQFSMDLGVSWYPNRPNQTRLDKNITLDGNLSYRLSRVTTILFDLQWIDNISNLIDAYQYRRVLASAGVSFSL